MPRSIWAIPPALPAVEDKSLGDWTSGAARPRSCRAAGAPQWRRRAKGDAMPTYRDEAVVLRTHKLGEADRIVTMLSR
ncbi:MAG: recombination protein O N-terminal domain-containing protein, partial [Actinomycetota bacterium]|nr:recombination protein O N-terminal domain-containing protein [Actinomycetota bacterium]